jgi:hypothetical protein
MAEKNINETNKIAIISNENKATIRNLINVLALRCP